VKVPPPRKATRCASTTPPRSPGLRRPPPRRLRDRLPDLGNSVQAQDVTQDVFVKVWRNPTKFDAKRGELGSYLRLLARSRALDVWREGQAAGRASDRLKLVVAKEEPRVEDRPAPMAEREDERSAVRHALRKLPDPQREAVVLAYWGGLTADQIARKAGVPLGTAKSRIRLGLARLRAEFDSVAEAREPAAMPVAA
jgi:RNA polymerase sigma-70 factor (ECF subfamily)